MRVRIEDHVINTKKMNYAYIEYRSSCDFILHVIFKRRNIRISFDEEEEVNEALASLLGGKK